MVTSLPPTVHSHSNFIDSLVQANMQPVMQELEDVDAFLESIHPDIVGVASGLYFGFLPRGIDRDDLVQDGMIAAWKATTTWKPGKATMKYYCVRAARYAMIDTINKLGKLDDGLMEDEKWLMVPATQPTKVTHHNLKKHRVNMLLATLPEKHRRVIMSNFLIQSHTGHTLRPHAVMRKYGLTPTQYGDTKRRAIAMLYRNASKLQA